MDTNGNTKELIKDLCSRLPYGVKLLHTLTNEITNLEMIGNGVIDGNIHDLIENFKPYLFPLSSMTEEQWKEFDRLLELELKALNDEIDHTQATAFEVDFYHKHHLDWRELIPMGLAIDATDLNIY